MIPDREPLPPDHAALLPLGRDVHDAVRAAGPGASALDLFRRARDVARERIPGPLGVAVAAVLGHAAYERAGNPWEPSLLAAPEHEIALALAVLDIEP